MPEACLYVGNLNEFATEAQLFDIFNEVAPVSSVQVCLDQTSLLGCYGYGYGYVKFYAHEDACHALVELNSTPLNGKPIRVMFSQKDPSVRRSGYATLLIRNLDESMDREVLMNIFSSYGTVLSCKVVMNSHARSKKYGIVQFEHEKEATEATAILNSMLVINREVYGVPIDGRRSDETAKFNNVYVKNLSPSFSEDNLVYMFEECGPIASAKVMTSADGKSRGFGFVCFEEAEHAATAVEKFNGHVHDGKPWYVGRAQRKSEREAELRAKYEQRGADFYVKTVSYSHIYSSYSGHG